VPIVGGSFLLFWQEAKSPYLAVVTEGGHILSVIVLSGEEDDVSFA